MSRTAITKLPLLARLYLAVAAADLLGAFLAIQTGLAPADRTIVSGTAINAPLPFMVAQLAVVTAAVAWRGRRAGTLAATLLVVIGFASLLSGFSDGSYASSLTVVQRAMQIAVVAATMVSLPVAAGQVIAAARARPMTTARASA